MKKVLATLLAITAMCTMGGWTNLTNQDVDKSVSLIERLEAQGVDSYEEFIDIIEDISPESVDSNGTNSIEYSYFDLKIDYDNRLISVTTMDTPIYDRSYSASNSVSRSYYTDAGIKIFTITVEGSFTYSTGSCTTTSARGSYNRALLSLWSSTPTISSGNISAKKAYARISGVATSGSNSISYSLTLTCDDSGNFSSY